MIHCYCCFFFFHFLFFSLRENLISVFSFFLCSIFWTFFPYNCSFCILLFLCKAACKTSWTCMKLLSYLSDLDMLGPRLKFVLWRDPVPFQTLFEVGELNRWYSGNNSSNPDKKKAWRFEGPLKMELWTSYKITLTVLES